MHRLAQHGGLLVSDSKVAVFGLQLLQLVTIALDLRIGSTEVVLQLPNDIVLAPVLVYCCRNSR